MLQITNKKFTPDWVAKTVNDDNAAELLRSIEAVDHAVQWALGAWWHGLGNSRKKFELLAGTGFNVETVKMFSKQFQKLSGAIAPDKYSLSPSKVNQLLSGINDLATINDLINLALSGKTIAQCRETYDQLLLPSQSTQLQDRKDAARKAFLSELDIALKKPCSRCDWSKLLSITSMDCSEADLYLAYVAYVHQCNQASLTALHNRRKAVIQAVKVVEPVVIQNAVRDVRVQKVAPKAVKSTSVTIDVAPMPINDPYTGFTEYERSLIPLIEQGKTVVAAMYNFNQPYTPFLKWAQSKGLVVKIDRTSKDWGNPFKVGEDGTIDQVMESYADYYLPRKFDLSRRIPLELKGKVLACWCKKPDNHIKGLAAIQPCHGDILAAIANGEK